ncbi:MAG TPA: hypothetical protein VKZ63_21945, partial [Kofleriaceae bacterium]|nr:hypothetical protein [Kofleriaceae bacterium]
MAVASGLAVAAGCNLILDADKYRGGPAGDGGPIDAGDDGGPPDAGPDAALPPGPLEPSAVWEGEGAGTGARPVVLVLRDVPGRFPEGTTARVGDPDLAVEPAVVSGDGAMLAVPIRVPVDPELADGEMAMVDVAVTPPGAEEMVFEVLTVRGLDEADLSGALEVADLKPRYSQVTVSGALALTGAEPARITAITDIVVAAGIDASGHGMNAPGPGGCAGGVGAAAL